MLIVLARRILAVAYQIFGWVLRTAGSEPRWPKDAAGKVVKGMIYVSNFNRRTHCGPLVLSVPLGLLLMTAPPVILRRCWRDTVRWPGSDANPPAVVASSAAACCRSAVLDSARRRLYARPGVASRCLLLAPVKSISILLPDGRTFRGDRSLADPGLRSAGSGWGSRVGWSLWAANSPGMGRRRGSPIRAGAIRPGHRARIR